MWRNLQSHQSHQSHQNHPDHTGKGLLHPLIATPPQAPTQRRKRDTASAVVSHLTVLAPIKAQKAAVIASVTIVVSMDVSETAESKKTGM